MNPAQQLKLRQLSLLTLSRDKTQLTYANLITQLGLASTRELEDVVISAVYAGLLTAKLNPIRQEVQVNSVAPLRDVPPTTVSSLVSTLKQWSARCDATLAELEGTVSRIRADAVRAAERRRENDQIVTAAMEAAVAQKEGVDNTSGAGQGVGRRLRTSNNQRGSHVRQQMGAVPGGGSSAGGSGNQAGGSGAKRGSEKLMEGTAGADEDDEAMDLDDDGDGTACQKRASRRKL